MFRSQRRRARSGPLAGRWGRLLAAVLVVVTVGIGNVVVSPPAHAAVSDNPELRRRNLFSAYMRSRTHGHEGLRHMYVSAEMVGYRQLHPDATSRQVLEHGVLMNDWYKSQLGAHDLERPIYQFMVKLLELSAKNPAGAVAAPIMQQLMQETVGKQMQHYGSMVDEIYASQFESSYLSQVFEVMDNQWTAVAAYGATDPGFRDAWNGFLGGQYGISADATEEQLMRDPVIGTYVDVQALVDLMANQDLYIAEGNRQLKELLAAINRQVDAANSQLRSLNLRFPVQGADPPPSELEVAKAAAAARQEWINGAAGAVRLLSTLVSFANPRAGQIVAVSGNAAVQIATAVNSFLPTLAVKGLSGALFSMTGVGLAANVLGAMQTLLPLFADVGPTPEQQIIDEVKALRQEVGQLRDEMHDRFNRVESALAELYDAMYEQFGVLVQMQRATQAQLDQITHKLAGLTEQVDFWGHALFANDRDNLKGSVVTLMNTWLDFRVKTGREMEWLDYYRTATGFQDHASNKSRHSTMMAPIAGQTVQNVLGTYGPGGSIGWLNDYAKKNLDTGREAAPTDTPSIEFWLLAAEAYKMLVAQNPAHARTINGVTEPVVASGEAIQEAVRLFSKPQPAGSAQRLNPIFGKLLDDYRTTGFAMVQEIQAIRGRAQNNRWNYDIAGRPDQPVEKPAAEPGTAAVCAGTGVTASRPGNVVSLDLQEMWVAAYGRPDTPARTCYEARWVNVSEPVDPEGDRPYSVYADLEVTFKVQQVWDGQPVVARTWTQVFPYGKIQQYYPPGDSRTSWITRPDDAMRAKWASTYQPSFAQSATRSDAGEPALKRKVRDWLYGNAGQYYTDVAAALTTPGTALHTHNQKLTQTVQLLRTYTKLGFARSIQQDERIGLHLLGSTQIPSDHGEQRVLTPFVNARDNYCLTITNGRCEVKPPAANPADEPRPVATDEQKRFVPCWWYTNVDPLERCFNELLDHRSDQLRQRLEEASVRIATVPGFAEGIPSVDYLLQAVRTAEAVVKHPVA